MADSVREKILAQLATVLADTAGIDGRVYRSRATPIGRDLQPAILLLSNQDGAGPQISVADDRTLTAQVVVLVRTALPTDVPDTLADPIIKSAHALIMADPTLDGNAVDVVQGETNFSVADTDQACAELTQNYEIFYRHSVADLTT